MKNEKQFSLEQNILCTLLTEPQAFSKFDVRGRLANYNWSCPEHGDVYAVICKLRQDKRRVDALTVADYFIKNNVVCVAGYKNWVVYLSGLTKLYSTKGILKNIDELLGLVSVKFRKLDANAVSPKRAHATDAGWDLVATWRHEQDGVVTYGTGLSVEIPAGYVGLLFPRSSVYHTHMSLSNCVGVIDAGYRGEVMAVFNAVHSVVVPDTLWHRIKCLFNHKKNAEVDMACHPLFTDPYEVGDRICQLIIQKLPDVEFVETDTLSESERGTGGYGSTGA